MTEHRGPPRHLPGQTPGSASATPSILFPGPDAVRHVSDDFAEYAADLHLDDIVAAVVSGHEDDDIAPFLEQRLLDVDAIAWRHEVFRDLQSAELLQISRRFTAGMRRVRGQLQRSDGAHYREESQRWLLDAADGYTRLLSEISASLRQQSLAARGWIALRDALGELISAKDFLALMQETADRRADLAAVRYLLRIEAGKVTVGPFEDAPDLGQEILEVFAKFRQTSADRYVFEFPISPAMNHVEAAIVERVVRIHPQPFAALDEYARRHAWFLDPLVDRFDRELQFYLAWLDYTAPLQAAGIAFCYPEIAQATNAAFHAHDVVDLALAKTLSGGPGSVVPNGFDLAGDERILVVSGPNSGGKTTFARCIGQLHHLAALGLPVPASSARVELVDRIFVHFERAEQVDDQSGKLEDDLRRMRRILDAATARSLIVMNESFSSTTVEDQVLIATNILHEVIARRCLCVLVTFLDELSSLSSATVSMVSEADPDEPARRTFRIRRRPADGLAYAMAIAERHGLTAERILGRVAR